MQTQVKPRSTGYLPSFDGWRALAILAVMVAHDPPWTIAGYSTANIQARGGYGVNLFFAISGILITTRILQEERLKGFFDIRQFYIRRIFRIQPAAMVYLAAIAALMIVHVIHDRWYYWTAAMFMFENFVWHPAVAPVAFFEGHFWTLAVEEHFYVLLSLFLLFVRRFRLSVLATAWVVFFVIEKIGSAHGFFNPELTGRRTYWQIDFLILAATAATALQQQPKVREWALRYWKPWTAFTVTIAVLILHRVSVHLRHPALAAFSVDGWLDEIGILSQFFFALWVVATMLHPRSVTTRLLEWTPLRYIGRLSYSLYLWRVLFFSSLAPETHITSPALLALSGRPAKYIAAFGFAMLSYYIVEKPMMRLGHRLAPPVTPGRLDLIEKPVGATG
ncbi:MAG TPA: acyltransferase [Acidobacteriaceae bacterium]|nr:acyltransferase [Acidobacteriaceae bacterium]